jgi:hypothetical protein
MSAHLPVTTIIKRLTVAREGSALPEFVLAILALVMLILGGLEFALAFQQYNTAQTAVRLGTRLAATTDPVARELATVTGLERGAALGDPMPPFATDGGGNPVPVVCRGDLGLCQGGNFSFDLAAMNQIVEGPDSRCGPPGPGGMVGLCDVFGRIRRENVTVTYSHSGLGTVDGKSNPIPIITVELHDLNFNLSILGPMLGLGSVAMPSFSVSMPAEDMRSSGFDPDS